MSIWSENAVKTTFCCLWHYRSLRSFFTLVLILWISACTTYRIKTDVSDEANFFSLHTYSWFEEIESQDTSIVPSPLLISRLKKTIDLQLAQKGYKLVEPFEDPDFKVNFILESKDKQGIRARPFSLGIGLGIHPHSLLLHNQYETYEYTKGSLSIDLYRGSDNTPLWRGSANKNFIGFNADVSSETVTKVVQDIFAPLPGR